MSLKEFLAHLRRTENLTVQFSHLGYTVYRNGECLEARGNHAPGARPSNAHERMRRNNNMYCALSVVCDHCTSGSRAIVGDVLRTLRPGART